jgi:hypothetical protein
MEIVPTGILEFKNDGGSWDSLQTIMYNYVSGTQSAPVCTNRYATTSVKTSCGFTSDVYCNAGEFVMSGGMYGGANDAVQTSSPIGTTGWDVVGYDINSSGACSQNYIPNGTIATGNPPHQGAIYGGAVAICCHM